jgi:plasmid stability protein
MAIDSQMAPCRLERLRESGLVDGRDYQPVRLDACSFDSAIILLARRAMARVLIRDLDQSVVEKLKARASRNGRSLQAELHLIVERAAAVDVLESRALAARIRRKLSGRKHSDSAILLADDRRR